MPELTNDAEPKTLGTENFTGLKKKMRNLMLSPLGITRPLPFLSAAASPGIDESHTNCNYRRFGKWKLSPRHIICPYGIFIAVLLSDIHLRLDEANLLAVMEGFGDIICPYGIFTAVLLSDIHLGLDEVNLIAIMK
ncbi:hypothetical protein CEXT_96201 [Caerostris extrusa]|uniref:Uncharacterized protein n=1 Tax=Caerostris extrusa TaxID=172846 RepID=A0AAV4UL09_CAEEX|nr:hypothetical protein CEXT_96201 [Caerostris extrusa]